MIWFGWVWWHINHCRLFNAKSSLYIHIRYIWFDLVRFYGISTLVGYLNPDPLYVFISNIYYLVCLVLGHINHCRLFNVKSSFYIYIKYIGFGLVRFYGISTIVGYLQPNPLYTYISNIYDLVCLVLGHINHCRLFNANSSLYIYIKYIWFGLVGFYGISTIVGYLMPIPLYTYMINIYDLVWLGFVAYQPL